MAPLPQCHKSKLGDSQNRSKRARMRVKLQGNPKNAMTNALTTHALHGFGIRSINELLEADHSDAIHPAKASEVRPDLALSKRLQQTIAS